MSSRLDWISLDDTVNFTEVVAVVLTHKNQLALLRRSNLVTGDIGCWSCITGFLDPACEPFSQALVEVEEEAGIADSDLLLQASKVLDIRGGDGRLWRVHAFHFQSRTKKLQLNWENDACIWLHPQQVSELETVPWFSHILDACEIGSQSLPAHLR